MFADIRRLMVVVFFFAPTSHQFENKKNVLEKRLLEIELFFTRKILKKFFSRLFEFDFCVIFY